MRNQLKPTFFLTFFLFALLGCSDGDRAADKKWEETAKKYQSTIDAIEDAFIPDQRVDRFKLLVSRSADPDCPLIKGYTTNKSAVRALFAELSHLSYCHVDSVRRLPFPNLGSDTFGIVNVSVANLRTVPKHSGELTTQALLGMPLKVYDRQNDWFLVQTPDRYIAWLEKGAFVMGDRQMMRDYYSSSSLVYLEQRPNRPLTASPAGGLKVRDLTPGSILRTGKQTGDYQEIILPDGTSGYLPITDIRSLGHWQNRAKALELNLLATNFYGQPYLWGGTSTKGMDCSGFTKMTYLLNGYVIPRDASQQVHAGQEVDIVVDDPAYENDNLKNLRSNDLLFFGKLREDGSQRISHVGIYLGNGRFAHAGADNGYIREESLYRDSPEYAAHRRESLLRAKRLSIGSTGVISVLDIIRSHQ